MQQVEINPDELAGLLEGMDDGGDTPAIESSSVQKYQVAVDSIKKSLLAGWGNLNETLSLKTRSYEGPNKFISGEELNHRFKTSEIGNLLIEYQLSGTESGKLIIAAPVQDLSKMVNFILELKDTETPLSVEKQKSQVRDTLAPFIISSLAHINEKNQIDLKHQLKQMILLPSESYDFGNHEYLMQTMHFHLQNVLDSKLDFIIQKNIVEKIHYIPAIQSEIEANVPQEEIQEKNQEEQSLAGMQEVENHEKEQIEVQDINFSGIQKNEAPSDNSNIDIILDVKMNLTVELGRTSLSVRELLDLGEGSIIELEKLVGEPIELLVHDKLIAKGEVVVIDEHFGVRITDIISSRERIQKLKKK